MLAIIPIIAGFLGSLLPKIFEFFTERADRRHELAILELQIKQQESGHTQRLEEIRVQAQAAELGGLLQHDAALTTDSPIISGLRASVRPVMTYMFFGLFCAIKIVAVFRAGESGMSPADMIIMAWDADTAALFSAIVSFWFGHRALEKIKG